MKLPSRRALLGLGAATIATVAALNVWVLLAARSHIVGQPGAVPTRQAALVLGAHVFVDGQLSGILEDRVQTAIDLYRAGRVKKLLLTGDHGTRGYDEVNAMRRYVLREGVPAEDVFMDHAGFDTYDSIYRARDVFGVEGVVIVTQAFHLPRAVYTARALGLDAVGLVADRRPYALRVRVWLALRESLSRVKALLEIHVLHARPRFLGPRIPITGDGRRTVDEPPRRRGRGTTP